MALITYQHAIKGPPGFAAPMQDSSNSLADLEVSCTSDSHCHPSNLTSHQGMLWDVHEQNGISNINLRVLQTGVDGSAGRVGCLYASIAGHKSTYVDLITHAAEDSAGHA